MVRVTMMDYAWLARETVNRLAPYLARLLSPHSVYSSADKREKEAFYLWRLIYPKIALRSSAINAARKTSVENTNENRATLVRQLTQVFRTNQYVANQVSDLIGSRSQQPENLTTAPRPVFPQSVSHGEEYSAEQVTCQVCGRQDETIRLVSYPYVFSIILVTLRRVFQGVYCARHANRYFFLAVFITLTVGWMGIPFGFIFTPITIFNLLTADKNLKPVNAKILLEIAKYKQEKGDPAAAAVYAQEALWVEDNPRTRSQVRAVGSRPDSPGQPAFFQQVFILLGMFVSTGLMGFLIGLIDGVFTASFYGLEETVPVLVIIFSYLPLLLMLFFAGFLAARLASEAVQRAALREFWMGRLLGSLLSIEMVYTILSGRYLFISRIRENSQPGTLIEKFFYSGSDVVHGGWRMLLGFFRLENSSYILFGVLVLFGGVLVFWLLQDAITRMVKWRMAMDEITGRTNQESGFLALAGAIIFFAGVYLILDVMLRINPLL